MAFPERKNCYFGLFSGRNAENQISFEINEISITTLPVRQERLFLPPDDA